MKEIAHATHTRPWEESGNVNDGDVIAATVPGRGDSPQKASQTVATIPVAEAMWKCEWSRWESST